MVRKITVVVIDDHPLFRTGVIQTLGLDPGLEVVGDGGSGEQAIELARRLKPDVILLDISMPGNGMATAATIAAEEDAPRVVMLTVSEENERVIAALEAGAVGYILKGIEAVQLIAAVRNVANGETFVSPNLALPLLSRIKEKTTPRQIDTLSEREKQILRLVAQGLSNRQVGEALGVLEKTVKFHMTRIMEKLNVRNRVVASLIAQREWGPLE
ncbi:response regulator [Camelimonas sp. ID_303_24]